MLLNSAPLQQSIGSAQIGSFRIECKDFELRLFQGKRQLWEIDEAIGYLCGKDPGAKHFWIAVQGRGIFFFSNSGSLRKSFPFSSPFSPCPILYGDSKFVVFSDGAYHWSESTTKVLEWTNNVRKYYCVNLNTLKVYRLPKFSIIGLPYRISASVLESIVPKSWWKTLSGIPDDELIKNKIDLETRKNVRSAVKAGPHANLELFHQITQFSALSVQFDQEKQIIKLKYIDGKFAGQLSIAKISRRNEEHQK